MKISSESLLVLALGLGLGLSPVSARVGGGASSDTAADDGDAHHYRRKLRPVPVNGESIPGSYIIQLSSTAAVAEKVQALVPAQASVSRVFR